MEHSYNKKDHWKSYALFFKTTMAARKLSEKQLAEKAKTDEVALKEFLAMKKPLDFVNLLAITDALGLELYFEPRDKSTSLRRLFDKGREEMDKKGKSASEKPK